MKNMTKAMAKIKLWQEECKLVVMFIGAAASATTFFYKLFHGGLFSAPAAAPLVKEVVYRGGRVRAAAGHMHMQLMDVTAPAVTSPVVDTLAVALAVLSLILIGFSVYFLIKVFKKHTHKAQEH
jgi:hypothetical protein